MSKLDKLIAAARSFADQVDEACQGEPERDIDQIARAAVLFERALNDLASAPDVELRFKLLNNDAREPKQAYPGDGAFDLAATEAGTLAPGEHRAFGTGIAVAIPEGYAGLVVPRSGLAAKHAVGVVNGPGLVDAGYRGEVRVILINHGQKPFEVAIGDRIAQLMLTPVPTVELVRSDELDESVRGEGGFGSSGVAS